MTSALLDANLLIYTLDPRDPAKRLRASEVIDTLSETGAAAVSTQTLAEFYHIVTRKLPIPFPTDAAETSLLRLSAALPVILITLPIVLEAARGAGQYQMSYWDAQVWATAKLNQIPYVLTENMQERDILEGVRFLNPLAEDFDLATLTGRR